MTATDIITGILQREGGYIDHPSDKGGPTKYGITANAWGLEKHWGRQATRDEVSAITEAQARDFYQRRYLDQSPFRRVAFEPLRVQLIDFGLNSGNERATRWLQRAIGVPQTGIMDQITFDALNAYPPRLVNNALVAARLKMIDDWTDGDKTQKVFEEGVESRALAFFLG
jgi:lysozyme family protein